MVEDFNPRRKALKKALIIISIMAMLAILLPLASKSDGETLMYGWSVSFLLAGAFLIFLSYLATGAPTDYGAEATRTFTGARGDYRGRMKNQMGYMADSKFLYMLVIFLSGLAFIVVSAVIVYVKM